MTTATVTDLKAHLSAWLDQVEHHHETVEVVRHGHVVARMVPVEPTPNWKSLRGKCKLIGEPEQSVLSDDDFEALA